MDARTKQSRYIVIKNKILITIIIVIIVNCHYCRRHLGLQYLPTNNIPFTNFITFADFRNGHSATINLLLYYRDVRACALVCIIRYLGILLYIILNNKNNRFAVPHTQYIFYCWIVITSCILLFRLVEFNRGTFNFFVFFLSFTCVSVSMFCIRSGFQRTYGAFFLAHAYTITKCVYCTHIQGVSTKSFLLKLCIYSNSDF